MGIKLVALADDKNSEEPARLKVGITEDNVTPWLVPSWDTGYLLPEDAQQWEMGVQLPRRLSEDIMKFRVGFKTSGANGWKANSFVWYKTIEAHEIEEVVNFLRERLPRMRIWVCPVIKNNTHESDVPPHQAAINLARKFDWSENKQLLELIGLLAHADASENWHVEDTAVPRKSKLLSQNDADVLMEDLRNKLKESQERLQAHRQKYGRF